MESPRKVLTIVNGFDIGGIERTLSRCLPFFNSKKIILDICVFKADGPLKSDYQNHTNKIFKIKKTGSIFFDMIQLGFILFKERPKVVHSRFGFTSGGFVLICWLFRIPVVVSLHSESSTMLSSKEGVIFKFFKIFYLGIHKIIIKKFSTVIVGHSLNNLTKYDNNWGTKKKYRLIYNGITINENILAKDKAKLSLGLNKNTKYILHVGSFRYEKNHKLLLKIFKKINKKNNNTTLLLVGDGVLRNEIEQLASEMNIRSNVMFCGQQKDVMPYYKAADVFLFPSINEGLGNVIIESQTQGLPVVCSSIMPHFEALSPLQHSNMFDLENNEQAVNTVLYILDKGVEESIINNSKTFVEERFDIRTMANKLAKLYNSIR